MARPSAIAIIGMGQLGSTFSVGFLRRGYPVYPLLRDDQPADIAAKIRPITVVAAVGETDLPDVLSNLPDIWKYRVTLLSNELLPATWLAYDIQTPTVISVQFEKKQGQPIVVDRPSPVFGPQADLIIEVLNTLSIPTLKVEGLEAMTQQLVLKNMYILTLNLGSLATHGAAGELLSQHRDLTEEIWADLFAIQQAMVAVSLDRSALMQQTMEYLALAPERRAGRSAGDRLQRALNQASALGIKVPTLENIKQEVEI